MKSKAILKVIDGEILEFHNEEVEGIIRKLSIGSYHVCFRHNLKVYKLSRVGLICFLRGLKNK